MMRLLSVAALCLVQAQHSPDWRGVLPYPVSADSASLRLFEEALRWGRTHQLETGGCMMVSFVNDTIYLTDAIESVRWRRARSTQLRCRVGSTFGVWHTHWMSESDSSVGCNMDRAADLYLIHPLYKAGVAVCGHGVDSLRPFAYDASREPPPGESLPFPENPTCEQEPPASLARPGLIGCSTRKTVLEKDYP